MKSATKNRRKSRRMFLESLEDRRLLAAAPHPFDLSALGGTNGFRMDGVTVANGLGAVDVSKAGDVNGDGVDDVVVGARFGEPDGRAYVVFGDSSGSSPVLDLNALDGANGFQLVASTSIGDSVDAAGDFNGDGIGDLVIGTPSADWNATNAGGAYVLYGRMSGFPGTVNLDNLNGADGFRLDASVLRESVGYNVGGAGDVNGDGLDDIVLGSLPPVFNNSPGTSYIVFGSDSGTASTVQLDALDGSNGFRLDGATVGDAAGQAVSGAGDINGDGFDDVLIGAWRSDYAGSGTGSSYVLFGKSGDFAPVENLGALDGSNGFRLDGIGLGEGAGWAVSAAGDLNGDGLDDVAIGAEQAASNGEESGTTYIVFGKTDGFAATIGLASLDGINGFRVDGIGPNDHLGSAVSSAGDFNNDGYDDVLLGAPQVTTSDDDAGASYVLFGRPSGFTSTFDLTTLDGSEGFRLDGFGLGNLSGRAVSGAGDINADGFDDIIIGADGANPQSNGTGSAYVVFGSAVGISPVGVTAELIDDTLTIRGTNQSDSIRVSGDDFFKLIEGLDGTLINGQPSVTFHEGLTHYVVIDTGAGGDVLILDQPQQFNLDVNTGSGKDFVQADYAMISPSELNLDTGKGDDHIVLQGSPFLELNSRFSWINTGNGDDRVEQRGNLGHWASIEMGNGDDVLQSDVDIPYGLGYSFDGGAGNDRLLHSGNFGTAIDFEQQGTRLPSDYFLGGDITTEVIADPDIGNILVIKGKDHFDHDLQLTSSTLGQVTVASSGYDATIDGAAAPASFDNIARVKVVTGSGTDTILAEGLLLSDKLIVNTSLGDDRVQVVDSLFEKLKIDTGGGDDVVLIETSTINRRTKVVTGWGEDHVTIRDSIFSRKVTLESGLDDDTLHRLGVNLFSKGLEEDFEQVFSP